MPFAATWVNLEPLILSELSQKVKDKYHIYHLYLASILWHRRTFPQKIMDLKDRLVVAKGEGKGIEWTGSLGLIDATFCLWNGLAMISCCVALETLSSHL